jgi:hypothetical protein
VKPILSIYFTYDESKNETKKIRHGTKRNDMVRETKRNQKYIEYQETGRNETISFRKRND